MHKLFQHKEKKEDHSHPPWLLFQVDTKKWVVTLILLGCHIPVVDQLSTSLALLPCHRTVIFSALLNFAQKPVHSGNEEFGDDSSSWYIWWGFTFFSSTIWNSHLVKWSEKKTLYQQINLQAQFSFRTSLSVWGRTGEINTWMYKQFPYNAKKPLK